MERIKVSKNFYLDEFIDPYTFFTHYDNGMGIADVNLFNIAQFLRDMYGKPIGINNWWNYYIENETKLSCNDIIKNIENNNKLWWKGAYHVVYKWSGYRPDRCKIGASQSAHRTFQAIDPKGPSKQFNQLVEENAKEFYRLGVRRLEHYKITPGWLHLDTKEHNTEPNSIRVVNLTDHVKTIRW